MKTDKYGYPYFNGERYAKLGTYSKKKAEKVFNRQITLGNKAKMQKTKYGYTIYYRSPNFAFGDKRLKYLNLDNHL